VQKFHKGTVKWFNKTKGFGFIVPAEGGKDVFVHLKALHRSNLQDLAEGDKIEYTIEEHNGRNVAGIVKILR
jgi:cold shock protein